MQPEIPSADELTAHAFRFRKEGKYAAHPVEAALRYHRSQAEKSGPESHGGFDFESAEVLYRASAQGLRLSEIPQLPQSLAELSRLGALDRAARSGLRQHIEIHGPVYGESLFLSAWEAQGRRGGAEHHVHHDQDLGRWFKRLHRNLHYTTLGDYFDRLRLHEAIFPETAYRLEGFTINPKNKELAPVVSQPHVEVDTSLAPVSKDETDALMAGLGFAPVQLRHDGIQDDGYFAYVHPVSGVLVFDLHDENVVRLRGTDELVVIDPFICLARRGTWAALKLAEIGLPEPADDRLGDVGKFLE
jgi:hypothetical protein